MFSLSTSSSAMPLASVLYLTAFAAALMNGWLSGRRYKLNTGPVMLQVLVCGLLVARGSHVLLHLQDYLLDPLTILDPRQGGFIIETGLASAALVSLFHAWRRQQLRRPLATAAATGAVSWALMAGAVSLIQATHPTVPGLALAGLDGEWQELHDLNDRPMVINMWASWCPPCRREMPVLAEAQQHNADIRFVFINQGESDTTVSDYLRQDQLQLQNVLLDPMSQASRLLNTRVMPSTYFFDASGRLVDTQLGELSTTTLNRSLKRLVGEP